MKLYDYWRSSAAYRVRIALNLKSVTAERIPVDLRLGHQRGDYRQVNAVGLVPALDLEPGVLHQSLAILEYLDEQYPTPKLLPGDAMDRAQVRALCQDVACDMHPLNNLRVLKRLKTQFQASENQVNDWYRHWVNTGLAALETQAGRFGSGDWLFRNQLSLADVTLIPQVYNALRFNVDMTAYPRLWRVYQAANEHPAFAQAAPDQQAQQ